MNMETLMVELDEVDLDSLLVNWLPVFGTPMLPMLVTALGDAFVQHEDRGTVYFLDAGAGLIEHVCESADELNELLEDPEFIDHYFDPEAVARLAEAGLERAPDQVYALRNPASAGGSWELGNIELLAVAAHLGRGPR